MLRQALDAAQGQQQVDEEEVSAPPSEITALEEGQTTGDEGYGATTSGTVSEEETNSLVQSSDDEAGEEDYLLESEWEEDDETNETPSVLEIVWTKIKNAFFVVANVENLWDTPPPGQTSSQAARNQSRRNHLIVLFWFVVLAASYAGERSTYKLLVDRAGPFRLFAVEMVTATHAIMLGSGMFLTYIMKQSQNIPLGIPLVDVGLMALLDTASLLLVFLTGYHVPPTLTVILVQGTLPLTAFLTQFVHPDGKCSCCRPVAVNSNQQRDSEARDSPSQHGPEDRTSQAPDDSFDLQQNVHEEEEEVVARNIEGAPLPGWGGLSAEHVWGSLIIFLAVLLALFPAFYSIADPDFFIYADTIPLRTALNTLIFVSSCIPAAASQLYKEHIFLQYKQPVNMDYLNLLLSIFQFIFASVMSPLVYGLQGLGAKGDWTTLYPSEGFSENFLDGLLCFFRLLSDDDQENKYYDDARCDFTLGLTLIHAFSIIAVGVAVDKIVNAGAVKVMYRGISAGIILAVLSMHAYDMHIPEFSYGPVVDGLNLVCLLLLILGSEVYHRVSLQESTFETIFPEVRAYYDED